MFPMCHIYFASRVLDELSDYAVLGCIYPDMLIPHKLTRDITHYNTNGLYGFFKDRDSCMKDFAGGAVTHGVDMTGLDYYSDESYPGLDRGYCFERGREIEQDVIDCCSIPEKWGLWKAHNFIEMAFDLYLCNDNEWIMEKFNRAINNSEVVRHISRELEEFYNISASMFEESFRKFVDLVQYNGKDEHSIMERYAFQLKKKHDISNVNISKGASVLLEAVEIIKPDAQNFFMNTAFHVKEVMDGIK